MKSIVINNVNYEVVENINDALDEEVLKEKITDYFDPYDYIVGDWSYGKLRLKGFYDEKNKKVTKINNIKNLKNYIENYCAYGCKYFVIQRKNEGK